MTLTAKQFRTEAFEMAATINASQYAGDLSPFPEDVEDTPAGLALTLAIVAGGYGFTVVDGYLFAIVSGDMGYTNTGIKVK